MRFLLLFLLSSTALAQGPGGEKVEFAVGAETIFGYLFRPAGAQAERRPAVVIVHGSGGVRQVQMGFWAGELNALGVVALVTDSFTPRGVDSTVEDQSRVTSFQMTRDAFAALAFLSRQEFVDAKRVALMGMTKGGTVALLAADRQWQRTAAGHAFAAHLPLYPSCTLQYRNPRPTAPVLMLIGERDNYTGVKLCAAYTERLRAAGGRAELKVYPGAHHGFDGDPSSEREFFLARAENYSDCVIFIEDDGKLAPFDKGCIRRGASVASSHRARMQALEDAKAFLKTTLFL
jgi:dienelactone hydrolase